MPTSNCAEGFTGVPELDNAAGLSLSGHLYEDAIINGLSLIGAIRSIKPQIPIDLESLERQYANLLRLYGPCSAHRAGAELKEIRAATKRFLCRHQSMDVTPETPLPFGLELKDVLLWQNTYKQLVESNQRLAEIDERMRKQRFRQRPLEGRETWNPNYCR